VTLKQNLLDPQTFNLYSYANDNPIVRKDPTGLIAGWDDIIAMGIGGTVNLTAYALATKLTGQPLSRGDAISAFAAGAVVAEGIDNAPETGGTSILAAARIAANLGGRAALTGEVSKQLAGLTTGDQKSIDYKAIALSPLKGYIGGAILGVTVPDVCIPGLSCGSNNWNGIGLQMGTKYGQGLISQVSISTSFKAAAGSQTKSFGNTFTGAVLTASASRNQPTQSSGNAMSTWLGYFNPFTSH
jgi:hypothetical protein